MKKLQLLLVSIAMLSMFSCSDDDDDTLGVWYRRSDFDGRAREDAAGFVMDIGEKTNEKETVGNIILITTGGRNVPTFPKKRRPGTELSDLQSTPKDM